MFKTRLISGILLVIAALLTIISGNYVLFVTLLCVSLLGMQELYKAMGVHKEQTEFLELAGYLGAILYYVSLLLGFERYGTMAILIALILIMFVYVFSYPKYNADQVMATFFGVVYVAVMLSFILLTRNLPDGKFIVYARSAKDRIRPGAVPARNVIKTARPSNACFLFSAAISSRWRLSSQLYL